MRDIEASELWSYGLLESVSLLSSARLIGLRVDKDRINPLSPKKKEIKEKKQNKNKQKNDLKFRNSVPQTKVHKFSDFDEIFLAKEDHIFNLIKLKSIRAYPALL